MTQPIPTVPSEQPERAGRHRTEATPTGEVTSWRAEAAEIRQATDRSRIARRTR